MCCGKSFSSLTKFKKHLKESHTEDYNKFFRPLFKKNKDKAFLKNKRKYRPIQLLSKSKEDFDIQEPPFVKCSRCNQIISKGAIYKETSIGEAVLCKNCEYWLTTPKLQKVKIIYTAFESSRRRH